MDRHDFDQKMADMADMSAAQDVEMILAVPRRIPELHFFRNFTILFAFGSVCLFLTGHWIIGLISSLAALFGILVLFGWWVDWRKAQRQARQVVARTAGASAYIEPRSS
jgi:hypothetical protein